METDEERQGMAGWKSSGKRVGEGQPLQWKKVEECLQLRLRTNKPQSWRLVVARGTFSRSLLAEPEARTLCLQGGN